MVIVIFILISFINILIAVCKKESKIMLFLSYFLILFLMIFNTQGPDIGNYIQDFNSSKSGAGIISEIGYNSIRYFFSNFLNFDFFSFRLLITCVCIYLMHSSFKQWKTNENGVIGLYMCYLFFVDTIQFRNFILQAILIYSTKFLFNKGKINLLKYIICILLASSIHKISLVYIFLIIVRFNNKKPIIQMVSIVSLVSFVFFIFFRTVLSDMIITATKILGLKSSYSYTATKLSSFPLVFLHCFETFLLIFFKKRVIENDKRKYIENVIYLCGLLMISMPLLLVNINFYRIFRNLCVLKYIAFFIVINNLHGEKKNLFVLGIILSTTLWFIVDYALINDFTKICEPIFNGTLINNNIQGIALIRKDTPIYLLIFLMVLFAVMISVKPKKKIVRLPKIVIFKKQVRI